MSEESCRGMSYEAVCAKVDKLRARVKELETAEEAVSRRWTHPTVAESDKLVARVAKLEESTGWNAVVATKEELVARATDVDALKADIAALVDAGSKMHRERDALKAKIVDLEEKLEDLDLKYNDYIALMEPDDDPERGRYG